MVRSGQRRPRMQWRGEGRCECERTCRLTTFVLLPMVKRVALWLQQARELRSHTAATLHWTRTARTESSSPWSSRATVATSAERAEMVCTLDTRTYLENRLVLLPSTRAATRPTPVHGGCVHAFAQFGAEDRRYDTFHLLFIRGPNFEISTTVLEISSSTKLCPNSRL